MRRVVFAVPLVLYLAAVASAQPPATPAAPPQGSAAQAASAQPAPARQATPAATALNEATAIKDADKKIAAIRKVIADFPKTPQVSQAHSLLLEALIKKGDKPAIAAEAKAEVADADESSRPRVQRDIAAALLKGNVLLEDAEAYARAAADSFPDEKAYIEARKKEAAARSAARPAGGQPGGATATPPAGGTVAATPNGAAGPNSDEMLSSRYKTEKQAALSTLGQVYAKRGNTSASEKSLREAFLVDTSSAAAATAALKLAEFAKAAGRDNDQLDYLAIVALAGRLTPEADADFKAVYGKLHGGSLEGLDAMLDARYGKNGPKAPAAQKYERAADRTDRLVLAEVFTGAGCPPCVAADLAFDSAMHRYGASELTVLMYHLHAPRPDPMVNPSTQSRARFYAVPGVPTYVIDGDAKTGGGSASTAASFYAKSVEPVVDKRLVAKPEASLSLKAALAGGVVKTSVAVTPGDTKATKLRLHIALAEEEIRYSGENGIRFHPRVVRSMASTGSEPAKPAAPKPADDAPTSKEMGSTLPVPILGFPVEPGKGTTIEYAFDLAKVVADGLANLDDLEQHSTRFPNHKFVVKKHEVDATRLVVVAFLQDEESKQILQAAEQRLK